MFNAALRSKSDRYGLVVGLCGTDCHRLGKKAVHNCAETALSLKQHFQIKFMQEHGYSVLDFIDDFGKNYLDTKHYEDERSHIMNCAAVTGRLTRDPDLRYTSNNVPVCSFTLAVDRPGGRDKTDFIDCVAWRERGEFVAKYFRKGMKMELSGVVTTRTYEKNGNKIKATEIVADNVYFAESKKENNETAQSSAEVPTAEHFTELNDDDEELPF